MRTEYILIGILGVLIISLALLLAGIVYFLAPEETTTTTILERTTTTTTTQTTTTTSSSITTIPSKEETTTTTTIGPCMAEPCMSPTGDTYGTKPIEPKQLTIQLQEGQVYKYDDLEIKVLAEGSPVRDVIVTLDNSLEYRTDSNGRTIIQEIDKGDHNINVMKEGYKPANATIDVYPLSYANSPAVKIHRTPEERASYINQGKIVFIFYDRPNCPNCMAMKQWVDDIVNENRECIMYELLKIIYQEPRDEVKELFPDQASISTPVIVIHGPRGRHVTAGYQPRTAVTSMLNGVADRRCMIQ